MSEPNIYSFNYKLWLKCVVPSLFEETQTTFTLYLSLLNKT